MQKVFPVLALIAFAGDISRILVHGDSARKPEAAGRNGGYEYQVTARNIVSVSMRTPYNESVAFFRVNKMSRAWKNSGRKSKIRMEKNHRKGVAKKLI